MLLDVTGMRCAGCVSRVKVLLERESAVQAASVNLATETAMVRVLLPALAPGGPALETSSRGGAAKEATLAAVGGAEDVELGLPREQQSSAHQQQLAALGTQLAAILTAAGYAASMRDPNASTAAAAKVRLPQTPQHTTLPDCRCMP